MSPLLLTYEQSPEKLYVGSGEDCDWNDSWKMRAEGVRSVTGSSSHTCCERGKSSLSDTTVLSDHQNNNEPLLLGWDNL